tara:strand:+ start:69 stop:455 length:387 start_codon:yes stop_codon:yes gene_type:complete
MAEMKKALSNNQKATILLDMLRDLNTDAEIDKNIRKRKYKVHPEKLRNFKYEMQEIITAKPQIKSVFGVSFKSMQILENARFAKQRIEDRIQRNMTKMYNSIAGVKTTKSVQFGTGTTKQKIVEMGTA